MVIATRHDTHARFTVDALRAGKHVFVEKPLALNSEQLEEVIAAQQESGRVVIPGFNQRFSPLSVAVRDFFARRTSPIEVICRVNAGPIKADSWYKDDDEGGWRIVSEGCHFVDLIQFICGCPPVSVSAAMIGGTVSGAQNDNCVATLKMKDGSLGMLIYVANGDPNVKKERIEDWRSARLWSHGKVRKVTSTASPKGHAAEIAAFVRAVIRGTNDALPFEEALATTLVTFAIARSSFAGNQETVQV